METTTTTAILIVLSALTVIFALFACFIALVAILGWKSIRDFKIKQKGILAKHKKIVFKADKEIKLTLKNANKLVKEIEQAKGKIKTSKDIKEYEAKTEKLVDRLKGAIREAKDKVDNLRMSGIPTSSPTDIFSSSILGSDIKICKKCGRAYINSSVSSLSLSPELSQCPYCNHLN